MKETNRNSIVGVFVLLGIAAVCWLVFQFGDLPAFINRMDARDIHIMFPEAPGVQENTAVLFRGYQVGKVVEVNPPVLVEDMDDPSQKHYQIEIIIALEKEHHIPTSIVPKVFKRGLGGSYVDLVLTEPMSETMLQGGERIQGVLSEASEFISESTQRKLDMLITSLTDLSNQLKGQLTPLTPEEVDKAEGINANVTTAVMRLDKTLKDLDMYLADAANRENFKKGLEGFAAMPDEVEEAVKTIKDVAEDAKGLVVKAEKTMDDFSTLAKNADGSMTEAVATFQETADTLAVTLKQMNTVMITMTEGDGTVSRMMNDPRLYESLNDTTEQLQQTLDEMKAMMKEWKEEGIKTDISIF